MLGQWVHIHTAYTHAHVWVQADRSPHFTVWMHCNLTDWRKAKKKKIADKIGKSS